MAVQTHFWDTHLAHSSGDASVVQEVCTALLSAQPIQSSPGTRWLFLAANPLQQWRHVLRVLVWFFTNKSQFSWLSSCTVFTEGKLRLQAYS